MKKKRIMLSKVKERYAQKISVGYRMAQMSGMETSLDTSFDQYCEILRNQGCIIVDDTRMQRIKKITNSLTSIELDEVEAFIAFMREGKLEND